ncbi:unnamed protein product [Aphanomyces euteiches]
MSLLICGLVLLYIVSLIVSYIPHPPEPSPTPRPTPPPPQPANMSFNVIQYNIFGRPYAVSKDGQEERLARIPATIQRMCPTASCGGIDVVTFAEADIDSQRQGMLDAFRKQGFNYHTTVVGDTDPFTSLLNGGVIIVSKWPILREAQHIYRQACHYSDCLAAKGVKYARINKTVGNRSKAFNVFATHMQAWSTEAGRTDRIKQAEQFHAFAEALHIPHTEPLIFAGDFNVDNHSYPGEVRNLINLLHASTPRRTGRQQFTSDPRTNLLVGRDGAAQSDKCSNEYVSSWGPIQNHLFTPSQLTRVPCNQSRALASSTVFEPSSSMCFCPCCPLEWLDYILYANRPYQQPIGTPTLEAIVNQASGDEFIADWTSPKETAKMRLFDYSDHYPVLGKFNFVVNEKEKVKHLDGCSNDNDCHFHDFRCYCEGSGCYFQGKPQQGTGLPSTHPVNKNCILLKTRLTCGCGPT